MAAVKPALAAAAAVLLAGCALLVDSAEPPFGDRVAVTRSVEDVFEGFDSGWFEMNVLDNGSRQFLVVFGIGPDGRERIVAFDSDLRRRLSRAELGEIRTAFVHVNGDFVIGDTQFDRRDFSLKEEAIDYSDPPPSPPRTGMATDAGVLTKLRIPQPDTEQLETGPRYTDTWDMVAVIAVNPLHPDPASADPLDPDPLPGFELRAAHHDPARNRSGLVLWNDVLSRFFVIELSGEFVDELVFGTFMGEFITDLTPYISVSAPHWASVFYTRRGVVVVDDDHTVYRFPSGSRRGEYSRDWRGEFSYAYSPDGRWVYMLDRSRLRLYKAHTWW